MMYSEELIEQIRSANNIVDVIGGYVSLKAKGNNHWGCCPFHNEKTPSFSVSAPKQMYYCFGCHESGNVITFLMKYENASFTEALKQLADRANIALPEPSYSKEQRKEADKRTRILEVNKEAAKYFYYQLRTPAGKIALDYLKKRGLEDETIQRFGLGFAPKNSAGLVEHLRKKGYQDELIREAGLATFHEKYGLTSLFWNRVMFPIQDGSGRVIGFGGRVMGEGNPKYLNSPETPVFDKRRHLYAYHFARASRKKNVILCEGYMDVISLHQAGFDQAMASLGTAFTPAQANLVSRLSDEVYLAYDSDGAGTQAARRNIGILRQVGIFPKVIDLSPHKDPDEFIKAKGNEAFLSRIKDAENSFFFEIRILSKDFDLDDPQSRTAFHREIAKKLCTFSEELERKNYLDAVAKKYDISAQSLQKMVAGYAYTGTDAEPMPQRQQPVGKKDKAANQSKRVQRMLLSWLAKEPALYTKAKKYLSPTDFTDPFLAQVAEMVYASLEKGSLNVAGLVSRFANEEEEHLASGVFFEEVPKTANKAEKEKAFKDLLLRIKKDAYEYYAAEAKEDAAAGMALFQRKKELQDLAKAHIEV